MAASTAAALNPGTSRFSIVVPLEVPPKFPFKKGDLEEAARKPKSSTADRLLVGAAFFVFLAAATRADCCHSFSPSLHWFIFTIAAMTEVHLCLPLFPQRSLFRICWRADRKEAVARYRSESAGSCPLHVKLFLIGERVHLGDSPGNPCHHEMIHGQQVIFPLG